MQVLKSGALVGHLRLGYFCTFYFILFLFERQCIWHESANWGHYFSSPNGDGTAILRGHPSHAKVSPLAVAKEVPSFLSHFKTLSNGPAGESNPRPPALQSNALPTELILPRLKIRLSMFSPEMSLRVWLFPLVIGFSVFMEVEIMKRRFSVTSQNMKELLFEVFKKVSRAMMWKFLISKSQLDLLSYDNSTLTSLLKEKVVLCRQRLPWV